MAFGLIVAAVASTAAGAIMGAANANKLAKKRTKAYKMAAALMKDATEKYSGHNADMKMRAEGEQQGNIMNNLTQNRGALESNLAMQNALGAADRAQSQDSTVEGINLGRENAAKDLTARYNAAANQANMYLKNAEIENAVGQQQFQNLMGAIGSGTDAIKDLGALDWIKGKIGGSGEGTSDERMKEPPSEDKEELPEASVEDALRQIDSVNYEYKDPTYPGCDDETHTGITAQSLEKGAFKDAVQEDANGIKKVDIWKLNESIMAGLGAMQKEIDELEGQRDQSKNKSK